MQIDRIQFYQELILREQIRKIITKVAKEAKSEAVKNVLSESFNEGELTEEQKLRRVIRKMLIKEAGQHDNTGVNYLDQMFKNTNILDALRTGYQALTTDAGQRESFRAHIINAVVNALAPERAMGGRNADDQVLQDPDAEVQIGDEPKEDAGDPLDSLAEALTVLMEEPIEVNVGDAVGAPDDVEMIPEEEPESSEEEEFAQGLEGPVADMEDKTGRNAALETFKTVEKHIKKYYGLLGNDDDRKKFYDYMITNLKLYFNTFEEEMAGEPTEPTTPEYEQEVDNQAAQGEGEAEPVETTEAPPEDLEPVPGGEMAFEDEEELV